MSTKNLNLDDYPESGRSNGSALACELCRFYPQGFLTPEPGTIHIRLQCTCTSVAGYAPDNYGEAIAVATTEWNKFIRKRRKDAKYRQD